MIFRQLLDYESFTYTYLLASRVGGEALLIDPVLEHVPQYLKLLDELGVKLAIVVDTHTHADHVTGAGELRGATGCAYTMGQQAESECLSYRLSDDETLKVDGLSVRAIHTPGHTDDSYSFVMDDRVFSGDTLLIRGTGRTDFQNGDPALQYDSLFNRLLALPEQTLVYPAHDYNGQLLSTVQEEKLFNPRLQVQTRQQYIDQMNSLDLDPPKKMGVAVPANRHCGQIQGG